jgi:hypothetical protein
VKVFRATTAGSFPGGQLETVVGPETRLGTGWITTHVVASVESIDTMSLTILSGLTANSL